MGRHLSQRGWCRRVVVARLSRRIRAIPLCSPARFARKSSSQRALEWPGISPRGVCAGELWWHVYLPGFAPYPCVVQQNSRERAPLSGRWSGQASLPEGCVQESCGGTFIKESSPGPHRYGASQLAQKVSSQRALKCAGISPRGVCAGELWWHVYQSIFA